MRHAVRRPMGRLFYWVMAVVIMTAGFGLPARGGAPQTSPTTTIVAEVRMHDFNRGIGNDRDLLGRFSSQTFSLPRLARTQTYFMRLYSSSSPPRYSRYAASLHVDSPP